MTDDKPKPATLDDVVAALQHNQKFLEDISTWVKIGNAENVGKMLNSVLNSPEKITVYHLSDGNGSREINAICGVSIGSISNYWNAWYRLGLMKTMNVKGKDRFIKVFDLAHYGIVVPSIAKREQTQEALPQQSVFTEQETTVEEKI